jgi:hypothetical protein
LACHGVEGGRQVLELVATLYDNPGLEISGSYAFCTFLQFAERAQVAADLYETQEDNERGGTPTKS